MCNMIHLTGYGDIVKATCDGSTVYLQLANIERKYALLIGYVEANTKLGKRIRITEKISNPLDQRKIVDALNQNMGICSVFFN